MKALRRAADASRLLLDLVTCDPPFVRGGGLDPRHIRVFTFHSLDPVSFERKMRYLRDAGYQAIGMSAYLDALFGRQDAPPKSVLITIDDGRATTILRPKLTVELLRTFTTRHHWPQNGDQDNYPEHNRDNKI